MKIHLTFLTFVHYILPATSFRAEPLLAPFYEVHQEDSYALSNTTLPLPELRKRNDNCPDDHFSCSKFAAAYGGACCASGYECTTDGAHQIACCTIGAKCTGTIDRPTITSTEDAAFGSSTMTIINSMTSPAVSPTMTSPVVNNIYFPFPYSPTTFSDKAVCLSAIHACQNNYAACTASLLGTNYGVTIIAPGGGITVAPTAPPLGFSSATQICSSLSSQACYGIAFSDCDNLGTTFVSATVTNALARPTFGSLATAGIIAGMGWEVARQMV